MSILAKKSRIIPGFSMSLTVTLGYLTLMVLIPLTGLFIKTSSLNWSEFLLIVNDPRVVAACRLSVSMALSAAAVNAVFGTLLAWVLVRYSFPGRALVDALVDLPVALPTAVAGLALSAVYADSGAIGQVTKLWGWSLAFSAKGIFIALIFVGLPFIVRTVQPVLAELEASLEEAANTLGANSWQTFRYVLLPQLLPAVLTGSALAFGRAVGEYGSVIFIAGNVPMESEIAPLLIVSKLEQYDYAGATAIAIILLFLSMLVLGSINLLQARLQRYRLSNAS